ncbi:MAG: hypothetical protein A3D65_05455 [Candidatus Lloydbacteria bacterium RIFCSPHIGHO2_02_FULL_50_13]|uniref:Membrane protein insertion efficiency factor n=1 Tax=Candidatus Lloydbacteria bacterium RIFCSPHIGHO2_02_FULL_50_13 TaxID=1798661 RepID=A0A1G2D865_9BACT|nr:MAG: hypothetical protein A3D65_05455 [Candidatus Lloydbacteria bacterium RIFCSPHIGHO2_02_FULL_50_13]
MKTILRLLAVFYQQVFSPDTGFLRGLYPTSGVCRMYPSCSEYMKLSILKHGAMKGSFFGVLRIGRCHPFQKKLVDVP